MSVFSPIYLFYEISTLLLKKNFRRLDLEAKGKKVFGNEKEGGSGRGQMIGIGLGRRRSRFAVFCDFVYFVVNSFHKKSKFFCVSAE